MGSGTSTCRLWLHSSKPTQILMRSTILGREITSMWSWHSCIYKTYPVIKTPSFLHGLTICWSGFTMLPIWEATFPYWLNCLTLKHWVDCKTVAECNWTTPLFWKYLVILWPICLNTHPVLYSTIKPFMH